jgi:hypothetical protein
LETETGCNEHTDECRLVMIIQRISSHMYI